MWLAVALMLFENSICERYSLESDCLNWCKNCVISFRMDCTCNKAIGCWNWPYPFASSEWNERRWMWIGIDKYSIAIALMDKVTYHKL